MKNIVFSFCCTFISLIATAQQPGGFNRPGGNQNMNIGHLYGKVIDSKTNKGIAGATVQLIGTRFGMSQRRDTALKHDSAFRKFDSTSLKSDSAFRRPDIEFHRAPTHHCPRAGMGNKKKQTKPLAEESATHIEISQTDAPTASRTRCSHTNTSRVPSTLG